MANTVENHISTYYHTLGKQTPFNVINATEGGPLKFDTQHNHVIARSIGEKLLGHCQGESAITIVSFDRLLDKVDLGSCYR
jgi:hypothetical protein